MITLSAFIILLGLSSLYMGAFKFGEWRVKEQRNYGVIATSPNKNTAIVILKVYGGKTYQAPISRETKRITGNIKVSNLEDLRDIEIRRERIGPLTFSS